MVSPEGDLLTYVNQYESRNRYLSQVTIIRLTSEGQLIERYDAVSGRIDPSGIVTLFEVTRYQPSTTLRIDVTYIPELTLADYLLEPERLIDTRSDVLELDTVSTRRLLDRLRLSDPATYRSAYTLYLEKYAFSLTPLIVILISLSVSWLFKRNILLFSVLTSLTLSVLYYVFEMITILFARQGIIQPLVGAWTPIGVFLILSIIMLRFVRT